MQLVGSWPPSKAKASCSIFTIQEQVANSIVDALRLQLSPDEIRALADRPIANARAYESYLRARYEAWRFTSEGLDWERSHVESALSLVGENELLHSTLGHITIMHIEAGTNPDVLPNTVRCRAEITNKPERRDIKFVSSPILKQLVIRLL